MKKKEKKELRAKLIVAVTKTLKDNNSLLTDKIEKVVKKSIKQIVKKSNKKIAFITKPVLVKKKPVAVKK